MSPYGGGLGKVCSKLSPHHHPVRQRCHPSTGEGGRRVLSTSAHCKPALQTSSKRNGQLPLSKVLLSFPAADLQPAKKARLRPPHPQRGGIFQRWLASHPPRGENRPPPQSYLPNFRSHGPDPHAELGNELGMASAPLPGGGAGWCTRNSV